MKRGRVQHLLLRSSTELEQTRIGRAVPTRGNRRDHGAGGDIAMGSRHEALCAHGSRRRRRLVAPLRALPMTSTPYLTAPCHRWRSRCGRPSIRGPWLSEWWRWSASPRRLWDSPARSDVDRGGSRAKSAATSESREAFAAPATRESRSTRRTLASGYVASMRGTRTRRRRSACATKSPSLSSQGRDKGLGLRAERRPAATRLLRAIDRPPVRGSVGRRLDRSTRGRPRPVEQWSGPLLRGVGGAGTKPASQRRCPTA